MSRWRPLSALARAAMARPGRVALLLLVLGGAALWGASRVTLSTNAAALLAGRADRGALAALALHTGPLGGDRELLLLLDGPSPARVREAAHAVGRTLRAAPFADALAAVDGAAVARTARRHALALVPRRRHASLRRALTTGRAARLAALRRALLAPVGPEAGAAAEDPLGLVEFAGRGAVVRGELPADASMTHHGAALTSDDGRHALVAVRLRRRGGDLAQAEQIARALAPLRAKWRGRGIRLRATGAPVYSRAIARRVQRDLSRSALLGLVLATLALYSLLRWWPLLLAAPISAGLSVLCVLALAALANIELSALSLAFAAICIGLGVDAVVHLAAATRGAADARAALARIDALAPALGASTLTTLLAFAALSLASFAGLAQTGLLAAGGLGLSMLFALLIVPPLARWRPLPAARADAADRARAAPALGARLAAALERRAAPITLVTGALLVGSLLVASELRIDGDLAGLAPRDTEAAHTDHAIARAFARARHRLIFIARGMTLEQALVANDALAAALARSPDVASASSIAPLLPARTTQRRRLAALAPTTKGLAPALRADLERIGFSSRAFAPFFAQLAAPRLLDATRPPPALRPILRRATARDERGRHLVASTAVARDAAGAARLAAAVTRLAAARGLDVLVTSAPLASAALEQALRRDLLVVAAAAAVAVIIALLLLLRSGYAVLAVLVSLLVSAALFCALLVLCGLSLDLYAALLAPLLIGYGVDDHIYIARETLRDGAAAAYARSGRAVITTTATSVGAIGALWICETEGLRRLALSASIGLTVTMLCALLVLPALLAVGGRSRH